jgi:serine/threonine protein kinase
MTGRGAQHDPDTDGRIEELFDRARAMPLQERSAWLDAECRDDPALRAAVDRLLRAHGRPHTLLDRPLVSQLLKLSEEFDPQTWVGRRIDDVVIERHLATGGMGVIFEARAHETGERVALKLMQPELLSRRSVERFVAEAEILANLDHPGIARIQTFGLHTSGSQRVPYYTMELVPHAVWMTTYAAKYDLAVNQRLLLMLRVCEAVEHGHGSGVIHRDLKPANILVDASVPPEQHPQPKIIDFGIAQSVDTDLAITAMNTQPGRHAGTLQYMSPEQFETTSLEIDQRSDVYSLGLILYELLCGRTPYDLKGRTLSGAVSVVHEQEPIRPRDLCGDLPRDLETILLVALSKQREDRYASVAEMAHDIRCIVAGEAICARTPGLLRRSRHWIARRPWLSTSIGCAMILFLAITFSFLTTQTLQHRPYGLTITPEHRDVRLIAVTGRVIHTWPSTRGSRIREALFINERNASTRHGSLVVIGFDHREGRDQGSKDILKVFAARDPNRPPVWSSRVRDDELPSELVERGFTASAFVCARVFAIDLFPEISGDEIIAIYRNTIFSHCLLRIYDQSGRALYQFWHDGAISDLRWLDGPQLLVVTALNSEAYWEHRGFTATQSHYPWVVFAVRPQVGHLHAGWVTPTPTSNRVEPAWYRCVLPPDPTGELGLSLGLPAAPHDPQRHIRMALRRDTPDGGPLYVSWVIDEHGRIVSDSRIKSDLWRRTPGLPEPDEFVLADLPPLLEHLQLVAGPGRVPPPIDVDDAPGE